MASFAVVGNSNMSLISAIRNLVCPLCGASMMVYFDASDTVAATGARTGTGQCALDQRVNDRVPGNRAQSIECRQSDSRRRLSLNEMRRDTSRYRNAGAGQRRCRFARNDHSFPGDLLWVSSEQLVARRLFDRRPSSSRNNWSTETHFVREDYRSRCWALRDLGPSAGGMCRAIFARARAS